MKKCNSSTCDLKGQLQPLENFRKNKRMDDGLESTCTACKKKYYQKNKAIFHAKNRARVEANPEAEKKYQSSYRSKNKQTIKEQKAEYYIDNKDYINNQNINNYYKDLEKSRKRSKDYYHRENVKSYRQQNQGIFRARVAKRRAAKLQRTVSWANLEKIKDIYKEAAALKQKDGIQRHVHHIFPLQHKLASGLHVENNLIILTEEEHWNLNHNDIFS